MNPVPPILVDHRGTPDTRSTWRTIHAYAATLSRCGRMLARSAVTGLDRVEMERHKRAWSSRLLDISRTTLGVDGLDHVDPHQAYVLVSNHQSLLDPAAVITAFPGVVSFVAKEELSRVPVFSQALREAHVVFVNRRDPARAREQLAAAKANVADGISMWVAAEGTRSRDGALGKLKKGGIHVALALGVPLLPTWLDGTGVVLPPDAIGCRTGQTVWVVFGTPIPTAGLDRRSLPELSIQLRAALLAGRARATELRETVSH